MIRHLRKLSRFRLHSLFLGVTVACLLLWWHAERPREQARQQTRAGQQLIHERDRTYLRFVFDQAVQDHLVTVLGDSRLTHWRRVEWISCPDRKTIVSFGQDGALLAWNRDDGSIRHGFYDVTAAAFSTSPARYFMATADGKLQSWTLDKPMPKMEAVKLPSSNGGWLRASRDGRYIAFSTGSPTPFTGVWDRSNSKLLFELKQRFAVGVFSADGKTIVLVDADAIHEYDVATGKLLTQTQTPPEAAGNRSMIYAAAFSEDGERLCVADASGRIFIYDWNQKEVVHEIADQLATVHDLAIDDDRGIFAAGTDLRKYFKWGDPERLKTSVVLHENTSAVCAGPNGIVAGVREGRLVEMNEDNPRRMSGGPRVDATCFAFSPDGDLIALAGRDGQIVIRETQQWRRVQSWRAHEAWIRRLIWSPRGDLLLSLGDDNVLAAWDPHTGDEVHTSHAISDFFHSTPVFNETGDQLATFGFQGIAILKPGTFETIDTVPVTARGAFLFSHDGRRLFAGGSTVMVNVWDMKSKKLAASFGPISTDNVKLAISADDNVVFAVDNRNVLALDTRSGKTIWSHAAHPRSAHDLAIHPTLPILATSGDDGAVVLIDAEKGVRLKRLRMGPMNGDILQVDFSPDGKLLAAAMSNGAVVILRAPWE